MNYELVDQHYTQRQQCYVFSDEFFKMVRGLELTQNQSHLEIIPHHWHLDSISELGKNKKSHGDHYKVTFHVGKHVGEMLMADVATRVGLQSQEPKVVVSGVYLICAKEAWAAIDHVESASVGGIINV